MYQTVWSLFAETENQLLLKIIQENKTVNLLLIVLLILH